MKNKNLVIFGTRNLAELAWFYFSNDSDYAVKAFTVDSGYIKDEKFCGLPVIPFEDIADIYPPAKNDIFIALGYADLSELRKRKFIESKAMGYKLPSYISSRASVFGSVGENCFIAEEVNVQPFAVIKNNVTLRSGCQVGHHTVISDHCYIAGRANILGDCTIGEQCFIGASAIVRNGLNIGKRCIIGAGALMLSDAEADGIYKGVEAQRSKRSSFGFRIK